eukprot:1651337-Ditylum_brightwellii.AAC.1
MVLSCVSAFDGDEGYHGNLTLHAYTNGDNDNGYFQGKVGDEDGKDGKRGDEGYQSNLTPQASTDGDNDNGQFCVGGKTKMIKIAIESQYVKKIQNLITLLMARSTQNCRVPAFFPR